jgi:hypothetical protein
VPEFRPEQSTLQFWLKTIYALGVARYAGSQQHYAVERCNNIALVQTYLYGLGRTACNDIRHQCQRDYLPVACYALQMLQPGTHNDRSISAGCLSSYQSSPGM